MAKIFDVQNELHESPNRNNFDLTHKVHMTGKAGYIYPFLCQPVVPTDSWSIDTAVGVNFMPMWYPTQSNMRFIVHYFYVPYRLLMKDWKNTLEGLEEHELPYIRQNGSFYETGSLADFLGVPTNFILPEDKFFAIPTDAPRESMKYWVVPISNLDDDYFHSSSSEDIPETPIGLTAANPRIQVFTHEPILPIMLNPDSLYPYSIDLGTDITLTNARNIQCSLRFYGSKTNQNDNMSTVGSLTEPLKFLGEIILDSGYFADDGHLVLTAEQVNSYNAFISMMPYVYVAVAFTNTVTTATEKVTFVLGGMGYSQFTPKGTNIEISSHPSYSPYYTIGNTQDTTKIRAFAFRAYEMCYNAYYRNQHGNQPFVVDGQTKYNEYLPTDADGADDYPYALHQRNWELDAYTSCMPSPQQGDAPLVGVTIDGTLRVAHDDGTHSEVRLRDLDGAAGLSVSRTSIDPEHPEDARTIVSLASSGMTIADFRQGNALTRFLETSLRAGFRYADFIFAHFGKSPSHQELDMPIFLGGYTQNVDTSKVSNVSAAGDAPLGDFAGTAASFGASQHGIKHYFDDFGIVLGLVTLVPDAAYSQVLPKHFSYSERLDFYFPQFSQLGLQPITYEELCPIQSHAEYLNGDTSKLLTDTFGYQRPNHDLVWIPDTVHGLFRTSLAGSVINRRFGDRPELGDEFLRIKPDEVNDIFSVLEERDDIWIGQFVVKITAQRPIPRVVIPSLGR